MSCFELPVVCSTTIMESFYIERPSLFFFIFHRSSSIVGAIVEDLWGNYGFVGNEPIIIDQLDFVL